MTKHRNKPQMILWIAKNDNEPGLKLHSMDELAAVLAQEEREKQELDALLKDTSAEVLELRRGTFSVGSSSADGWSHLATVLVRIGPTRFKLKIECFDEGRLFECLWCSDPHVMQLLESEAKLHCRESTMHDLLRHVMFKKLRKAIVQLERSENSLSAGSMALREEEN